MISLSDVSHKLVLVKITVSGYLVRFLYFMKYQYNLL